MHEYGITRVMTAHALLIGIDDTDNLDTRGTGYRARCLAAELQDAGLAQVQGVTRHQLLVDDAIPYTSHNSSACISVHVDAPGRSAPIIARCRDFLLRIAAQGSDVGLCVSSIARAEQLQSFGFDAQRRVLERPAALQLAAAHGVHLEGLTGDHQGVVGALAAVGLHSTGNDGRYIWVEGIRELAEQTLTLRELFETTGIEVVAERDGGEIRDCETTVALGEWPRPIPVDGKATLLVEKNINGAAAHWKVVDKAFIKSYRP